MLGDMIYYRFPRPSGFEARAINKVIRVKVEAPESFPARSLDPTGIQGLFSGPIEDLFPADRFAAHVISCFTASVIAVAFQLAKKHGSAIGIGHPYKATLKTLEEELPKLKGKIRIVPASSMTHIPG